MEIQLQTRLDNTTQTVYWKCKGEDTEYPCLSELLNSRGLFFGRSIVVVNFYRGDWLFAKMLYDVSYDRTSNIISLNGLLSRFFGPEYNTIVRFANFHIDFAKRRDARVSFIKDYRAVSNRNDPDDDPDTSEFIYIEFNEQSLKEHFMEHPESVINRPNKAF